MAGPDQSVGCGCRRLRLVQASNSNRAVVESIRSGQQEYIYFSPADLRRQDHRERREKRKKRKKKSPSRIPSMSHQMRRERGQMKAVSGEDKVSQRPATGGWVTRVIGSSDRLAGRPSDCVAARRE